MRSIFLTPLLAFTFSSFALSSVADTVELKTEQFALRFSADGKPASFRTLPDGKELLTVANPGAAFCDSQQGERRESTDRFEHS